MLFNPGTAGALWLVLGVSVGPVLLSNREMLGEEILLVWASVPSLAIG